MTAHEYYQRLINNLEDVKLSGQNPPEEIKSQLKKLGSFLYSRSSQFEMLNDNDDASLLLSVCKSNRENLILVFNYFLADHPLRDDTKKGSNHILKTILDDFDKATNGFKNDSDHVKGRSGSNGKGTGYTINTSRLSVNKHHR